ncbi:collagen alpha-1(I) chain-like, partial [Canis lupus familiaris]|uniref:collagen alpha-1(I) chain-like n=1 Tax=Canis lupus familiaris TaxID=9615 RepID=UPI0018F55426
MSGRERGSLARSKEWLRAPPEEGWQDGWWSVDVQREEGFGSALWLERVREEAGRARPKRGRRAAWAGNRTRASRVAGENSTTEPPMHRWRRPPDGFPSGARRRPGTASGEHPLRGGGRRARRSARQAPAHVQRCAEGSGSGSGSGSGRRARRPRSQRGPRGGLGSHLRPLPGAGPPPDTVLPGGAAWPSLTRARFPGSAGRLWPAQLSADLPFTPGAPPKAHGRMALRPVQCAPEGAGWGPELGLCALPGLPRGGGGGCGCACVRVGVGCRRRRWGPPSSAQAKEAKERRVSSARSSPSGRLGCRWGEAGRCAGRSGAGWLAGGRRGLMGARWRPGAPAPQRLPARRGPGEAGLPLRSRAPRSHHGGVDPTPPPRARPSERGRGSRLCWRAEGSAARLGGRVAVGAAAGKEEGNGAPGEPCRRLAEFAEARGRRGAPPDLAARSPQPQRGVRRDRQGVVQARGRLRPERSALDRSAILTAGLGAPPLAWLGPGADPGAGWRPCGCATDGRTDGRTGLASRSTRPTARRLTLLAPPPSPRFLAAAPSPSRGAHPAAGVPAPPRRPRRPPRPIPPARGLRLARAALLAVSGVFFPPPSPRGWAGGGGGGGSGGATLRVGPGDCCCALTRRPGGRAGWAVARGTCGRLAGRARGDVEGPGGRGQAGRPAGGRAGGEGSGARAAAAAVLVSIVVSIPACHAGDRGSIPRRGGETSPLLVAGAAAALPKLPPPGPVRPEARGDRGGPSCPPSTRPPAPPALPRRPWRPGALARAGSAQPSRDPLTGGLAATGSSLTRRTAARLPGCPWMVAVGGGADSEGPGAAGRRERPQRRAAEAAGGRACGAARAAWGWLRVGRRAAAGGARDGAELRPAGTSGQGCGRRRRRWREGEEALVRSLGRRPGAARAVQRWWYS